MLDFPPAALAAWQRRPLLDIKVSSKSNEWRSLSECREIRQPPDVQIEAQRLLKQQWEENRMLCRHCKNIGIAVVGLTAGLLFAVPNAHALKCHFRSKAETVSIGGSFSYDGASSAGLVSFTSKTVCPTRPEFNSTASGEGVNEWNVGTDPCPSFTGPFGETESGPSLVAMTLVGSATAGNGSGASFFNYGQSGTGCINLDDGVFAGTETDVVVIGTGTFKGKTGTQTQTFTGFTLAPPPASGAYGFFNWSKAKGTVQIKLH